MLDNEIIGDQNNNQLIGTEENERILGLKGDDILIGKQGDDLLLGGKGKDVLNGANPKSRNPGTGEIDILNGNKGADLFILGDAANFYYAGFGSNDYGLIEDFSRHDTIQLKGKAEDYILREDISLNQKSGTAIIVEETEELIGFIENVNNLSLDSNQFNYIELPESDKLAIYCITHIKAKLPGRKAG